MSPEQLAILGFDPGELAPPAPPPAAPAPAATPPAQPAQPAAVSGNEALLQAARELAGAAGQLRQPAQPQGDQRPAIEQVDVPAYDFTFPEPLMALIRSENPTEARQGMALAAKGIGQAIHQNVVVSMRRELSHVVPNIVQGMLRTHQVQMEVFQDFYGAFPQLNNPAIRETVRQTAARIAQERGHKTWNPTLRDEVGRTVLAYLQSLVQPGAQPNGQAPAPSLTPTGARPGGSAPINAQEREMLDLLQPS